MNRKNDIAIFPGSFDTFHNGHIHILDKALLIFSKVYIVISNNENKNNRPIENRYIEILNNEYILKNKHNIEIIKNCGLTIDILKKLNCHFIIRGIRDINDFKYEMSLYDKYKENNYDFEIVYFFSDLKNRHIKSSTILNKK